MKRPIFLTLALIVITNSCKQNYTCQCKDNLTGITTRTVTVQAINVSGGFSKCSAQQADSETCMLIDYR